MRNLRILFFYSTMAACGPVGSHQISHSSAAGSTDLAAQKAVLADVANLLIVPTYTQFAAHAKALEGAAQTFAGDRSAANLAALRDAWTTARRPWEQGEAFLFGPVETLGVDDNSDSWPVSVTDLNAVLNSNKEFTDTFVSSLDKNLRGFHAIEFLVFGSNGHKTAGEFTERQVAYLAPLTKDMAGLAQQLVASWTVGVPGQPAFKDTFAGAGNPGNEAFPTTTAALLQLVSKMGDISHELHASKLAVTNPDLIESQFSANSLKDFADNVRSVQNAYTTTYPAASTHGHSLSELVAAGHPDLDIKVKAQVAAAIAALGAIPEPFSQSLQVAAAAPAIKAASAALTTLEDTLNKDVVDALSH